MNEFITYIREQIIDNTSLTSAYTPDLPDDIIKTCAVTILSGNPNNSLCRNDYDTIVFRVLVRGERDDKVVRELAYDIYNLLNMQNEIALDNYEIINIVANSLPVFVGRDEGDNIMYNITFTANVKGE